LTEKSFENGIKEVLESQLPIFDDILAESQKPLSERPLAAAFYFVDYCIVNIKGDSKENFLEKEWFRSIYKLIKQWYDNRYGAARKSVQELIAHGVVVNTQNTEGNQDAHKMEASIFKQLMKLGFMLMQLYFSIKNEGNYGKTI